MATAEPANYVVWVELILFAYVVASTLRLPKIAKLQVDPVLEVSMGWTIVFVLIGAFFYPYFATSSLQPGSWMVVVFTGLLLASTDLWLFEHKHCLRSIYKTYAKLKYGIGVVLVLGLIYKVIF